MSSPTLKIAVIGLGLIGPRHASSIISNPSTTLICIIDPSPHGAQLAASLNTTHYPTISALLSSPHHPKPDAAIICTPNHTHAPLAHQLITAGIKNILIEKPFCTDIFPGIALLSFAKENGVRILVGHHRRFNPYIIPIKTLLSGPERKLGEIIAVQGIWALLKPSSYFEPPTEWRRTAGVIGINLIHEIDILQHLLGKIVWVAAVGSKRTRGWEAEEGAAILMRFEGGEVGTFILSDGVTSPWNFEAGTGENPMIPKVEGDTGGFYRVLGTEGSLSVPDGTVWSYNGAREGEGREKGWMEDLSREEVSVRVEKVPFDEQLKHFVDVIRDGVAPSCSGEEGLRAVVVCEAIKRAMKSGLPVEIEGFEIAERIGARL